MSSPLGEPYAAQHCGVSTSTNNQRLQRLRECRRCVKAVVSSVSEMMVAFRYCLRSNRPIRQVGRSRTSHFYSLRSACSSKSHTSSPRTSSVAPLYSPVLWLHCSPVPSVASPPRTIAPERVSLVPLQALHLTVPRVTLQANLQPQRTPTSVDNSTFIQSQNDCGLVKRTDTRSWYVTDPSRQIFTAFLARMARANPGPPEPA